MDWYKKYQAKMIQPEELVRIIKPGSHIYIGTACSEPLILSTELLNNRNKFSDCEVFHFLTLSEQKSIDETDSSLFRQHALFIGPSLRKSVKEGKADYIPIGLSDIPRLLRSGKMQIDVALLQVSLPDKYGYVSLGINVDINRVVAEVAKVVVVQINPQMPWTLGDSFISMDKISHFVFHDSPLIEFHYSKFDERVDKIGKYVSRLIENGSTIQVGIGSVPNAVLTNLKDKKDLAVFSEAFSDSLLDLIDLKVITCAKNQYSHIIASFVIGSKRVYDYVKNNPFIEFRSTEFTNNFVNIARNTKQIAINGALTVSITGEVNSDSIGIEFYSGVGGQTDFTIGASLSQGGKPIICLQSTNHDITKSRIVSTLDVGAGVTIPRHLVHYVITEYGIAYLHGKSIRDRVLQMIGIAHPKFRKTLLEEAKVMHYVYEDQMLPTTENGVVIVYPEQYESTYETKTMGSVFFRPVKPTDERMIQELYYQLNQKDRVFRFFTPRQSFPHRETQARVNVNYQDTFVIVGLIGSEDNQSVIAIGSYYLDINSNFAEIAFTVTDNYRNQGLTKYMLNKLISIGREKGMDGFTGQILTENQAMLHILKNLPYNVQFKGYEDSFEFGFYFQDKKDSQRPFPFFSSNKPQ